MGATWCVPFPELSGSTRLKAARKTTGTPGIAPSALGDKSRLMDQLLGQTDRPSPFESSFAPSAVSVFNGSYERVKNVSLGSVV